MLHSRRLTVCPALYTDSVIARRTSHRRVSRWSKTVPPWVLFDDSANTVIVSPATNFFLAQMSGDGQTRITSGLRPEVGVLEKPLTHSTLVVFGRGVGATVDAWGRILTDLYGKQRPRYDADPTLKYFGYWTDNGADYYYRYDRDLGYCGTLLKMVESYRHQDIPLGYFQLDSWWYQKSIRGPDGKPGADKKAKELPAGRWNRLWRHDGLHSGSGSVPERTSGVSEGTGVTGSDARALG